MGFKSLDEVKESLLKQTTKLGIQIKESEKGLPNKMYGELMDFRGLWVFADCDFEVFELSLIGFDHRNKELNVRGVIGFN